MRRTIHRRTLLSATAAGVGAATAGCLGGSDCSDALPTPVRGDPQADVTVQAFEDFACGHCRSYVLEHLPTILEEYAESGDIRYEYHDFPLPVDPTASWEAANAARAVQNDVDEEAFWTYSHRLYEHQDSLGRDLYESLGNEVGGDGPAVRAAAEDRRFDTTIECDKRVGEDLGVGATPRIFVDGEMVGAYDAQSVSEAIDDALLFSGA